MVATVSVYYDVAGTDNTPGSENDVDALGPPKLKFKNADNITIDNVNKVVIPAPTSTIFSFWKQIYLFCDIAPDNAIDTLELYSDGTFGDTGVDYFVGDEQPVKTNTVNTGYDVANTSDDMATGTAQHTDLTAKTSLSTFTAGSPKTITIGETSNQIDAVNETSHYAVLQMAVSDTASQGDKTDETITYSFSES